MARYKVKPGDSYLTLAKAYGLTPQALAQYNPGVSRLSTGMGINVPALGASAGGQANRTSLFQGIANVLMGGTWSGQPDYSGLVNAGVGPESAYGHNTYGTGYTNGGVQGSFAETDLGRLMQGYNSNVNPSPVRPNGVGIGGAGGGLSPATATLSSNPYLVPSYPGAGNKADTSFLDQAGYHDRPYTYNAAGVPTGFAGQTGGASASLSGFQSPSTSGVGEASRGGYGFNDPRLTAQMLANGQQITTQQALASGISQQDIQTMIANGQISDAGNNMAQNQPTPGTRTRTANGGTIIQGQPTPQGQEQSAYISPYARGQHWRVTTYKDENGNWVKATLPDYGGSRRNYRRGGANNQGQSGSGITGYGLVNFNVGAG